MATLSTDAPISPLRKRMQQDMPMRGLGPHTQQGYVRHVRRFAAFLGRAPDTATHEDIRRRGRRRTGAARAIAGPYPKRVAMDHSIGHSWTKLARRGRKPPRLRGATALPSYSVASPTLWAASSMTAATCTGWDPWTEWLAPWHNGEGCLGALMAEALEVGINDRVERDRHVS